MIKTAILNKHQVIEALSMYAKDRGLMPLDAERIRATVRRTGCAISYLPPREAPSDLPATSDPPANPRSIVEVHPALTDLRR